jgi:hypothetical protein
MQGEERHAKYMQGRRFLDGTPAAPDTIRIQNCRYDEGQHDVLSVDNRGKWTHAEGLEEPLVLAALVPVLEQLLDCLFRVFTLRHLLEGVAPDGALQALELERVSCGEEVGVVDDLQHQSAPYLSMQRAR